jgi:hypothetical protein
MYIYRLTILTLAAIMLLPSTAYAHCNGKHTGNHPHCTGDGGGDDGSGEYQVSDGVIINDPSGVSGFDFYIIGTPGQDTITAGSGADLIEGGDERDEIHALGDNDSIYGEGGDDSIDGGDGDDQTTIVLMVVMVTTRFTAVPEMTV